MYEVERSLVVVRAKRPFLDWIESLPDPGHFTLEEINKDSSAFLLPEYEDDFEKDRLIRKYFPVIFEEMLKGWWQVPGDYPSERNLKMFGDWFEVEFHSLVFDLADEE